MSDEHDRDALPPLLTRVEAAALLRISTATLDKRLRDGSLASRKIGGLVRIRREDVLALIFGEAAS
ncbi:helix-turn-helix domain-containing protein [Mycolicibacterium tokaiense]|uniref:DNA binding domain, excisionase family n=1 Tax=Mycolicibacterium tokaiense TaxID=39695 RepID=A0A378TDW3_9MYCO|nr:helix-turn-helix domain-containing protein [Mycolicibacterium tokaiense]BBY86507.1 hypothetical protein MTOK_22890 [Mycolicibacterium tokaiense]STZ58988.1 DNA binding domain, excisionase family [Mycolicibacterium tokaiense]